ncbi:DUF6119 family protein [Alkalihalobacillus sp. AL-G]|uniref:DUF6119 family protein n=1 Tax=Alkalihalobacillus sp. AL-G TaxID=2926399 RepID=UPI00272A1491|nr:DUF6119 family protein [Alkalihalobacillus sp. AL-G]WLD93355.1 TIGR04141 family sporadically distributed protein [Alkalihalobacillus sp. AL-G]
MASINIYRISENNKENLLDHLGGQYNECGERVIVKSDLDAETGEVVEINYSMTLYYSTNPEDKEISWNWVLTEFELDTVTRNVSPKSIILVKLNEEYYTVTFGHSYFKVDQYSDKEWAFDFARRLNFSNIRTTAITNPNSQRNKTVNTYLDYENLDFNSGEALTKLKAKIDLEEGFELFQDTIEIGNSVRFHSKEPSLNTIVDMIRHIEDVRINSHIEVKIPYFKLVKDEEQIEELYELMKNDIEEDVMFLDFSEYQIYATEIVFQENQEFEYKYTYNRKNKECSSISIETLQDFLDENGFSQRDDLLNIKVRVYRNGNRIFHKEIRNLIFYTNEAAKALLSNGDWYIYNEDYLQYLKDSIAEIPVEFDDEYNYNNLNHQQFLEEAFQNEKENEEFEGLSEAEIHKKIKNKYYKERYFNESLIEKDFSNFDRDLVALNKHKLEVADLYKDTSIYSVKFGNSSGKLCYAIDQSIEAIKAYHRRDIEFENKIENVYIWFVLERNPLPLNNGVPDINELEMLILKNKLDQWKKEVRLLGYQPKIRVNYKD